MIFDAEKDEDTWTHRMRKRLRRLWESNVGKSGVAVVAAFLFTLYLRLRPKPAYLNSKDAPVSLLYQSAPEGVIEKALLSSTGRIVYFLIKQKGWHRSNLTNGMHDNILKALSNTEVSTLPESWISRLATPALTALPFVYLAMVYRMLNNSMRDESFNPLKNKNSFKITFNDVAGIDHVVQEVSEVVAYLKNPSHFEQLGARLPGAILLHGPPGSGKTLIAQAVAGESGVDCFMACPASDFVEMYVGRGAARVRKLFRDLREKAKKQCGRWSGRRRPTAILFLDELDALAKHRSQFNSNDEREQTLNQLLTEMDGFDRDTNEVTVVVMAATNRADVLDPAILRRFERQVYVGYPDAMGRKAILQIHAKKIRHDADIDWNALANGTDGLSGADLRNMVNEAALLAIREDSSTVSQSHLEHAARRVLGTKLQQNTFTR
jgi:cell division protease FtsH